MSSFFVKGKSRFAPKPKYQKTKLGKKQQNGKKAQKLPPPKLEKSDEEIDSDEEEERTVGSKLVFEEVEEDDGLAESAQAKRLRLAKKYLQEVEALERAKRERIEDEVEEDKIREGVDRVLRDDYLESIGKLQQEVAHLYRGYDLTNADILQTKQQRLSPTAICLTDDDHYLYVANKNGIIVRWDLERKERLNSTSHQRTAIRSMAVSYDLRFLVVADGTNEIRVLDGSSLQLVGTLSGHSDVVTGVAIRHNSHQCFSCSADRTVKSWSLDEMLYVETLYGHQSQVTSIDALSRERAITSGGSDCSIRIWKIVEESQLVYNCPPTVNSIEIVRLLGDDHFVSGATNGSISVWNTGRKKPLYTLPCAHGTASQNGEPNWISALAVLLNTDLIASGSCDGFVRLWKLARDAGSGYAQSKMKKPGPITKLEPVMQIPVEGFVNCLAFTSEGKQLIVAVGQEHRLGRWWTLKQAKNRTLVIPLLVEETGSERVFTKKKRKNNDFIQYYANYE